MNENMPTGWKNLWRVYKHMKTSSGYRLLLSATTAKLTAQWRTKTAGNKHEYRRDAPDRNSCFVQGRGLNQGLYCAALASRQRGATNTALWTSATRPIRHGTYRPSVAFRHRVVDDSTFRKNALPPSSGKAKVVHVSDEMVGKKGFVGYGKDGWNLTNQRCRRKKRSQQERVPRTTLFTGQQWGTRR